MSERQVLNAVELAARMSGEPLQDDGRARYATHSLRVAGAVLAFQSGLSEAVVRSLGRWRSERAMLAYLRGQCGRDNGHRHAGRRRQPTGVHQLRTVGASRKGDGRLRSRGERRVRSTDHRGTRGGRPRRRSTGEEQPDGSGAPARELPRTCRWLDHALRLALVGAWNGRAIPEGGRCTVRTVLQPEATVAATDGQAGGQR